MEVQREFFEQLARRNDLARTDRDRPLFLTGHQIAALRRQLPRTRSIGWALNHAINEGVAHLQASRYRLAKPARTFEFARVKENEMVDGLPSPDGNGCMSPAGNSGHGAKTQLMQHRRCWGRE